MAQRVERLVVDEGLLSRLSREAVEASVELCGLLLGRVDGEAAVVEVAEPLENVAASPTSFRARPEDVYTAHLKAEERGLDVVGIYHSHPAPPSPSTADLEGMGRWPLAWLIISSLDGSTAAYQLRGGGVARLEVEVR